MNDHHLHPGQPVDPASRKGEQQHRCDLVGYRIGVSRGNDHYLKGSLFCQWGARMTINNARNRRGETYPYFICLGRHANTTECQRQAVLVSTVENLVAEHYRTIELSPEAADALAGVIDDIFDRIDAESKTQRRDLTRQKERLEDEQLRLLQSHYADAISLPALKKEQHRIEGMLADIDQRLGAYRAGREDAKIRPRAYLHLATNAHTFYLACDDAHKRLCNQAFFTKITLTEELDVSSEFTEVYETILNPANRLHAEFWQCTGQLHPDINLDRNEETLPTDHGAGLELRPNGGPDLVRNVLGPRQPLGLRSDRSPG